MKLKLNNAKARWTSIFSDVYFLFTLFVCVALLVFKFQDLFLPYFGDEMWVYGPSVRKMGIYGPSMLPSSLSIEDHWGHPMFFFFSGGIWCWIFGSSLFSTHLFGASISIALIITIYFFCKQIFNREIGFYTVLILACQSIFIGQFAMVLPEVMVSLFTLLTIYNYIKHKLGWYLLFGTCLVLTKESGVFPILAIAGWSLVKDFYYNKERVFSIVLWKKYLILVAPILMLLVHFGLLKYNYGWYILPDRMQAFEFSWEIYHERLMKTMHYVFVGQGRKPLIIGLFITAVLFNNKYKIWMRVLILGLAFSMLKVFFKYWKLPDFFEMIVIPILLIPLLKTQFWDQYKLNKKHGEAIGVFTIFIIIYLLFSSAQFDSLRYLLCLLPVVIMLTLYFVQNIEYLKKLTLPLFSGVVVTFSVIYIVNDKNYGDDTNNYSDLCLARQASVKFLEDNNYFDANINAPYLYRHTIKRVLTGYLSSNRYFTNVRPVDHKTINFDQCICIFESNDPSKYYTKVKNNPAFNLIDREEKGTIWIEIYKKN